MKINWLEPCIGSELQTIKNGACFIYDDTLYLKTDVEEQQRNSTLKRVLAVDLEDGVADYFFTDTIVIPIKAEITVMRD